MLSEHATAAVDGLIDSVTDDPTRLPLAEVAAVHATGHDVRIEVVAGRARAVVTRRRDDRFALLTAREHEVAGVVAAGNTNRQIAVALGISTATVKDHVHAILTKTGFETRTQLIAAWYGGLS